MVVTVSRGAWVSMVVTCRLETCRGGEKRDGGESECVCNLQPKSSYVDHMTKVV